MVPFSTSTKIQYKRLDSTELTYWSQVKVTLLVSTGLGLNVDAPSKDNYLEKRHNIQYVPYRKRMLLSGLILKVKVTVYFKSISVEYLSRLWDSPGGVVKALHLSLFGSFNCAAQDQYAFHRLLNGASVTFFILQHRLTSKRQPRLDIP